MNNIKVAGKLLMLARELISSTERYCGFYKVKNGDWYMDLAEEEDADYEDAYTYGPFSSKEVAIKYLNRNFSNPGSFGTDDSGKHSVPVRSPNGNPVQRP